MTEDQIQKVFTDLRNGKVLKFTLEVRNHKHEYTLAADCNFFVCTFNGVYEEYSECEMRYFLSSDTWIILDKSYYEEKTVQKKCTKHKQNSSDGSRSPKAHRHYDLILQWAANPEGFVVEAKDPNYKDLEWRVTSQPAWIPEYEYRLVPKKQTITKWQWLCKDKQTGNFFVTFWFHGSKEAAEKNFSPKVEVIQKIEESAKEFPLE